MKDDKLTSKDGDLKQQKFIETGQAGREWP